MVERHLFVAVGLDDVAHHAAEQTVKDADAPHWQQPFRRHRVEIIRRRLHYVFHHGDGEVGILRNRIFQHQHAEIWHDRRNRNPILIFHPIKPDDLSLGRDQLIDLHVGNRRERKVFEP